MENDYVLAEAIQLIKAGKKDAARVMLERYLQRNPDNIQAWIWEAETFPDDAEKIRVLEACLRNNPGNPQVTQALSFLKSRSVPSTSPGKPVSPFTTSPFTETPAAPPVAKKPLPFTDTPPAKSPSPFTTTSPFVTETDSTPENQPGKKPFPSQSPFETSQAEKTDSSPPEKKPAPKRSKKNDILVILGVVFFIVLLIVGYVGGGFYFNGQINRAFAARKCEDVLLRSSFISLYPQGVFSSLFTGYDQYTQCSLKLNMERAAESKDFASTLSYARQYLTLYPQGAFTAEINEAIKNTLSIWAKQLFADKDYSDGIEKSKDLVASYPDLPNAESVRDDILQAYLDWAAQSADANDFSGAEQNLKSALSYFETDAARAAKIKENLAKVYVSWGDAQAAIGNVDNAVKYYQQAGDNLPSVDVTLLIAKAYLLQAVSIADKSDFNRALTKVQDVENTASADNVKTEVQSAREEILKKYSASSSQQAVEQMTSAATSICRGEKPVLQIFGLDGEHTRFGLVTLIPMQLPTGLAAETPGQMHYVACAVEREKEVQTCNYGGNSLIRFRYEWDFTLLDTVTGYVRASQTIAGSEPAECRANESFSGVKVRKSYGNRPTLDQIVGWLEELNIAK